MTEDSLRDHLVWVWRAPRFYLRFHYRWLLKCRAIGIGPVNHRGTCPGWFCDRWRWHTGDHHDTDRRATWPPEESWL